MPIPPNRLVVTLSLEIQPLRPSAIRAFAQQGRTNIASEDLDGIVHRLAEQAISEYSLREGQIYDLVIDQVEKALLEKALQRCGDVKIKAADFLGINRNTLNKKVKEMGIESSDLPETESPA